MVRPFEERDTGRIYEARFLGKPTVDPQFLLELDKLPRGTRTRFRSDDDVYELYKKYFLDDPTNPPKEHAQNLRIAVIDALGLQPEEYDRVTLYSTVDNNVIDHGFGTDAFIEFKDPKTGKVRRVTIDLSLREKEQLKADVLIGEMPDAVQEEDAYLEAIEEAGHKIAMRLQPRSE
jgi:hypothetical protein